MMFLKVNKTIIPFDVTRKTRKLPQSTLMYKQVQSTIYKNISVPKFATYNAVNETKLNVQFYLTINPRQTCHYLSNIK